MRSALKNLLSISELGKAGIQNILDTTLALDTPSSALSDKADLNFSDKTVGLFFLEDSTRTRLSFEAAAKRLSAKTLTLSEAGSSLSKGESLRDTVDTLVSLGADCLVVRHHSSGVPKQISRWVDIPVINAGDGSHAHPTQALLDCYTIQKYLGDMKGLRILIIGDIAHSRVARSCIKAFNLLGAHITIAAPQTLLPPQIEKWDLEITDDLSTALETADVVYLQRLQKERQQSALLPSMDEYRQRFSLTNERVKLLKEHTLIMHPGPINRGVELSVELNTNGRSVVSDQVKNGVAVRTAVLYHLL